MINREELQDCLDSFIVMLELTDIRVNYDSDYNSIRIQTEEKIQKQRFVYGGTATYIENESRDLLVVHIINNRFIMQVNDYSCEKYSKIMIKMKKFGLQYKDKVNYSLDSSYEGINVQIVTDKQELALKAMEVGIQGIVEIFEK
jgi:hypothetical protein